MSTSPVPSWALQGVWEKDEIRKNDAMATFEEILGIATTKEVDFVLLGGGLVHPYSHLEKLFVSSLMGFNQTADEG